MIKHFLLVISALLFTSCGLRTFYLIDPPINANAPNPSDGDNVEFPILTDEFSFTARNLSNSAFISPGTDVYYRIYASQSDLQNDAERINDANDEDTNNGFKQLESLGYEKLDSTLGGENSLIDDVGGEVTIHLNSTNGAEIFVSGSSKGQPKRWNNTFFNFDSSYNTDDDEYDIPANGDDDFEYDNNINYFYVNAYAVSIGMDSTSFVAVQSEVLPLGFTAYEAN